MGIKQENIIREFCAAWGEGKRETPDKDKILSMLTEDAVWRLWVPNGIEYRGREEIGGEIDRQLPFVAHMNLEIHAIASTDRLVFVERTDRFSMPDKKIAFHLVAIFEINEQGKITSWREYFDTATVARDMGISMDMMTSA